MNLNPFSLFSSKSASAAPVAIPTLSGLSPAQLSAIQAIIGQAVPSVIPSIPVPAAVPIIPSAPAIPPSSGSPEAALAAIKQQLLALAKQMEDLANQL